MSGKIALDTSVTIKFFNDKLPQFMLKLGCN